MSSQLSHVFKRCADENRAALVGYLTAGDPNVSISKALMLTLTEQVDIIEIGMPFSDPAADGPVIQAASERALAAGTHISDVFSIAKEVRQTHPDIGIVLMGYANTPYTIGFDSFAQSAVDAGVDAVLLVDIPPEEGALCDEVFQAYGLDRILLLSPTSTQERIELVSRHASGFIYYVSLNGITGADMGDMKAIQEQVACIREHTDLPVCVGFGVKTPEQAASVAHFADGVVVGSHFVGQIPQYLSQDQVMKSSMGQAVQAMKAAVIT